MEVKLIYSKSQLDCAVEFLSDKNPYFLGQDDLIRETIVECMIEVARDPDRTFSSTMGFVLNAERDFEGIDCDENTCQIEIGVDPSIHMDDRWLDEDSQNKIVETIERVIVE